MSKAYKVTKHTVMFDKKNPKTVYSVQPVSYGLLTTDDVARQIAAESSATQGKTGESKTGESPLSSGLKAQNAPSPMAKR